MSGGDAAAGPAPPAAPAAPREAGGRRELREATQPRQPPTAERSLEWSSARMAAFAAPEPLAACAAPLADALDATLAAPLVAAAALPAFDCAAMDGYAVGSAAGPWRVVGRVLAGDRAGGAIGAAEAIQIATGAIVPAGTVAVLPDEHATRAGDSVCGAVGEPGRHVRRVGEDAPRCAVLVPAGARVSPTVLGLAATVGVDELTVRPRPRVAALLTGDEIVHKGQPGEGRVRDGVGPQLPGLVRWLGGDLVAAVPVPDTPADRLAAAVESAAAEVVLTCGGAARGPADRLGGTLARLGARSLVPGVACRPGHPQRLARLPDGRWLVGLPGNPYAALVAALTLLGPLLAGLAGRGLPALPLAALASAPPPATGRLTRIVPVRRLPDGGVEPVGHDRPGNLWGAAAADALAVLRPAWAGEPVPLLALP